MFGSGQRNREVAMNRRSVWVAPDLWARAQKAALAESYRTAARVTVAELVRRGLEREVAAIERREVDRG
jgi:hypothetical protein